MFSTASVAAAALSLLLACRPCFGQSAPWTPRDVFGDSEGKNRRVLAYADVDGDRSLDIISVVPCSDEDSDAASPYLEELEDSVEKVSLLEGDDGLQSCAAVAVLLWDSTAARFSEAKPRLRLPTEPVSIIATDLSGDGRVDLFAIFYASSPPSSPETLFFTAAAYEQQKAGQSGGVARFAHYWSAKQSSRVHPFLIDANSDGFPDFLFTQPATEGKSERAVWLNVPADKLAKQGTSIDTGEVGTTDGDSSRTFEVMMWEELLAKKWFVDNDAANEISAAATGSGGDLSNTPPLQRMAAQHSNALVDLNGDCAADIIIEVESEGGNTRELEIWLHTSTGSDSYTSGLTEVSGYRRHELSQALVLPRGSGQVTYGDYDGDGAVDIAVPSCRLIPSSGLGGKGTTCSTATDQTSGVYLSLNRQKEMCKSQWTKSSTTCRPQVSLCSPDDHFTFSSWEFSSLPSGATFGKPSWQPLTLTGGDIDKDGYPDLFGVIIGRTGGPYVAQLKNSEDSKNASARKFVVDSDTIQPGGASINISAVSPIEIAGDGRLNLLIESSDNGGGVPSLVVYSKSDENEVYFLKAVALSSLNARNVSMSGGLISGAVITNKKYGGAYPGASAKMTVTNIDGVKSPKAATQQPQSSFRPLSLPFIYFGMGKTNSYIEEFFLGLSTQGNRNSKLWTALIPNTQVAVRPQPLNFAPDWSIEMSVSPSRMFMYVLGATLTTLLALGGVIFALERRERHEDIREQQEKFRVHFITA